MRYCILCFLYLNIKDNKPIKYKYTNKDKWTRNYKTRY